MPEGGAVCLVEAYRDFVECVTRVGLSRVALEKVAKEKLGAGATAGQVGLTVAAEDLVIERMSQIYRGSDQATGACVQDFKKKRGLPDYSVNPTVTSDSPPAEPTPPGGPADAGRPTCQKVGVLTRDLTTDDRSCRSNCRGEPTRKAFRVEISVPPGEKVANPVLSCIAGPCHGWWGNARTIVDSEEGRAVGTFEMWTRPQVWRLTVDHSRCK